MRCHRPTAIPPALDPKITGPVKAVAAKHYPGLPLLPLMSTGENVPRLALT